MRKDDFKNVFFLFEFLSEHLIYGNVKEIIFNLSSSAPQPSTKVLCHVELIFHVIMSRLKPISLSNFVSPPVDNPANPNANATPAPACPPLPAGVVITVPLGITLTIPGFSEIEPTLLASAAARKPRLRSTPRMISAGIS